MKVFTIISTAAFTAFALAEPFDKVKLIKRQQAFFNTSVAVDSLSQDSTIYQTITPTSTIKQLKTIFVTIPSTTTSARQVVSNSVVVSNVVSTNGNGETTTFDVTSTQKITDTVYATITTNVVKTITAPTNEVQNVISSVINNDGVAAVDNIIVSKKRKTLTVTQPIYITVTASATLSGASPAVITSFAGNEVDTVTLGEDITSTIKLTTTGRYQNTTLAAVTGTADVIANANDLITTTLVMPASTTSVHTRIRRVTSTITNFIVVTHTATRLSETPSVETVTTVNEFVYNSQEVATETPTSVVTNVVTLTRTAFEKTVTETLKNTIYYTVTRTSDSKTVVETRSAVDTETKTKTNTFTVTIPVSMASATASDVETSSIDSAAGFKETLSTVYATPSFASVWNTTSVYPTDAVTNGFKRRHFHKRRFPILF
ncbi:hypothetical protein D0Z03_002660 [Geotrichum reessii]|nr:hypothetical protein D0Z03_002660 [Galactomyces reessii]